MRHNELQTNIFRDFYMTIKLTESEKNSLKLGIITNLPDVEITDREFVIRSSFRWADQLQSSLSEEAIERLYRYCGENGLVEFIYGEVSKYLTDNESALKGTMPDNLVGVRNFKDQIKYADEIVKTLETLP